MWSTSDGGTSGDGLIGKIIVVFHWRECSRLAIKTKVVDWYGVWKEGLDG